MTAAILVDIDVDQPSFKISDLNFINNINL